MTKSLDLSRRRVLKFLSGAPLLPLATGSSTALFLSACGGGSGSLATFSSAAFSSMAAPSLANPAAMATTTVGSSLNATYSNGATQNTH